MQKVRQQTVTKITVGVLLEVSLLSQQAQ